MRILVVQKSLDPPGGGNAVAAWIVHALSNCHDVATITTARWNASRTNGFYGTAIEPGCVRQHVAPLPWSWLAALPEQHLHRLRMASVLRQARQHAVHGDLFITADNYGAFARPGIQYMHFPSALHPAPARLAPIVNLYFALSDRLVGIPWDEALRNLTLANSRWTAEGLQRDCGVTAEHVVYPPVVDPGEGELFADRTNTFLCIGRFHGSKRFELSMAIVGRLRAGAMPDARLVIVGSAVDREYTRRLYTLSARRRDWVEIREDLSRAELNLLMGRCRFGLQAMDREHFGMATAEMVRAGCLVFTHRSGGSVEVVDAERRLMWNDEHEAVEKVTDLASDPLACVEIQLRLRKHARQFSTERFVEQIREIVASRGGIT